jgi:hypothetical protein
LTFLEKIKNKPEAEISLPLIFLVFSIFIVQNFANKFVQFSFFAFALQKSLIIDLGFQKSLFTAQLKIIFPACGWQCAFLYGCLDGAAWFGSMSAVTEPAMLGKLGDVGKGIVQSRPVICPKL